MDLEAAKGYKKTRDITNLINIVMDSGNSIVIELDEKAAPITVANFQKLVSEEFYNGIIFHRIIPGFMIQGGDPKGTGTGGSDAKIKGEFASNGVDNHLSHIRGAVSMARTQIPDSASSQFFICHADSIFLDGEYAAFGKVIEGMDEVDRIAGLKTNRSDFPETPPVMKQVFFVLQEEA
jgi:peptidyl-prolyl cis-trans isomerase B (cyclophilin B)